MLSKKSAFAAVRLEEPKKKANVAAQHRARPVTDRFI